MIRDRIVELRRVRAGDLVPNAKNWRRHPPAQRRALKAMLEDVGFADAVLARETDEGLVLIDGHLRSSLDPEAEVPVLILDVDQAEADRLLVTLDPLAGMAIADTEAFEGLVGEIDLPDDAALDELLRGVSGSTRHRGLVDPDEVPASTSEDPETQVGDLWRLGPHRLACGDASDPAVVEAVLEGRPVELLFTDPPYGVSYEGKTAERLTLVNDDLREDVLGELLTGVLGLARSKMTSGCSFYVCAPTIAGQLLVFLQALQAVGLEGRQHIVWVKDKLTLGHNDFQYRHEGILHGHDGDRPAVLVADPTSDWAWQHEAMVYGWAPGAHEFNGDRRQTTVWEIRRVPVNGVMAGFVHPTVKPVELVARAVALSSKPGALVFDPFLGSGSTTIAAQQLDRISAGVDIDPLFVERSVRRWEAFTGEVAERVPGGARG